jgi:NAD(P)-dependent dehydrogenase (short-subunit alcohol dehydrogenase family)
VPEPMSTDGARVAVVTGGAGAIGGTIVRALQASGHRTVVIDRDSAISADLGSEASTRQAAATVLEQYGRVDVFVQCAATFDQATLADLDATTLRHVFAVNVESPLWLAQARVTPLVRRRWTVNARFWVVHGSLPTKGRGDDLLRRRGSPRFDAPK